jgi:hypothetical protein
VDPEARPLAKALACDADHGGRAGFAGAAVLTLACDADHGGRAGFAGAAVLTPVPTPTKEAVPAFDGAAA